MLDLKVNLPYIISKNNTGIKRENDECKLMKASVRLKMREQRTICL